MAKSPKAKGGKGSKKEQGKFPPKKPGLRDVDTKRKAPPFGKK